MTIQTTPTGLTILLDKVGQLNELTMQKEDATVKIKLTDLELRYLALVLQQESNEE